MNLSKPAQKPAQSKINIEDIIKSHSQASDEAVKEALALLEKQKREQQSKQIVENYARLEAATTALVEGVRTARAKEKKALELLGHLNTAKEKFLSGAAYGDSFTSLVLDLHTKKIFV